MIRVLALGDVVGRPGRQALADLLPQLVREKNINFVVANGENIAGGSGITPNLFHKLRSYGVDVVTLGDHVFKRIEISQTLISSERIIRPGNLSQRAAGRGLTIIEIAGGVRIAVMCVMGRIFINMPTDDPFAAADRLLKDIPAGVKTIIADIHCEATSEKQALGHHLDGRVSLAFGTHTHIPTADARILPGGTAYISDVGMCGPYDSVLGRRKDRVLAAMTTNMPANFEVATGDVRMCGVMADIDETTGKATHVERIELAGKTTEAYDADDKRAS